jgi:hypothetical protein
VPPTFPYILALMFWGLIALVVWCVAGALALSAQRRSTAKRMALAMAGTFPGVLGYQLLVAPVIAVLLLVAYLVWKAVEPGLSSHTENPVVIVAWISVALVAFALAAGVSVVGFLDGWRTGWAVGAGTSSRAALAQSYLFRAARSLRRDRVLLPRRAAEQ